MVHARQVRTTRAQVAPDLAALVAHYQRELRLESWRIEAAYVPDLTDASGRAVWGLCAPLADAKVAKIVIRDPATPPDGATAEQALEQVRETVIHELAHLHFAPFGLQAPAEVSAEENAVWAFAEALAKAWGTPDAPLVARGMLAAIDDVRARLVASPSSKELRHMEMDPKLAAEAVGLLASKDAKGALDFLQRFVTAALGGKAEGEPSAEPPAEEPPPEPAPAMGAEPPPEEQPKARAVAGDDAALAFARSALVLSGETDPARALAELARRSRLAVELEEREAKLAADRVKLDVAERGKLVARLVEIGAETPHTSGLASGALCKRLADEPLDELRARVASLGAPRPKVRAASPAGDHGLSAEEIAKCKARGVDPEKYAALRAGINARSAKEISR